MPVQVDDSGGATLAPHRGARPHRAHGLCGDRVECREGAGGRAGFARRRRRSGPTSWCSPPASGPATPWPGRPGSTSPSAAASRGPAVPHVGPPGLGDRRVRRPRPGSVRPGRARVRDGRGRRRPRSSAGRAPSRAPTCRPSSSCSASTWRPSATRSRRGGAGACFADPVAGIYKKLVVSEDGTPAARRHPRGRRVGVRASCGRGLGDRAAGRPEGCSAGRRAAWSSACPTRRRSARATT